MAASGSRLDQWLVTHGYAETRNRARWLIESGQVWVRGQPCRKPSLTLPDTLSGRDPWGGAPVCEPGWAQT